MKVILSIFSFNKVRSVVLFVGIATLLFVCIIGFLEVFLYRVGETMNYQKVLNLQEKQDILYGPKYFNVTNKYKALGIRKFKPEVVIFGSSRVMSVRDELFSNNYKVYNAAINSTTGKGLDGMIQIFSSLDKHALPKVFIVGIDHWLFNPGFNRQSRIKKILANLKGTNICSFLRIFKNAINRIKERYCSYNMLLDDKDNCLRYMISPQKLEGIGLMAKTLNSGFRVDGSRKYSDMEEASIMSVDECRNAILKDKSVRPANNLDQEAVLKFRKLLSLLREENITFIGIFVPYHPNYLMALQSLPAYASFYEMVEDEICKITKEYNYECYNFKSVETLGIKDCYFRDIAHPGEDVMRVIIERIRMYYAGLF